MDKMFCEHCGHELYEFDINGNQAWNCPNDCDFEIACKEAKEEAQFEIEADQIACSKAGLVAHVFLAPNNVKTTNCWYCERTLSRLTENQDPPYGHFCPSCGHSLRDNPIYGVGGPRDRALYFTLRNRVKVFGF